MAFHSHWAGFVQDLRRSAIGVVVEMIVHSQDALCVEFVASVESHDLIVLVKGTGALGDD